MVSTFCQHSVFNEDPRYIMFIFMVINDTVQLTLVNALYVVSYAFTKIQASVCCPLILTAVLTTRATPLILAGMAMERYISICSPLHYSHICTVRWAISVIGVILALSAVLPLTDLLVALAVENGESIFGAVIFCDHAQLFRARAIYYKNCAVDGIYFSSVALTLLYTYCQILLAARAAAADPASVARARKTVLLHGAQLLLCMQAFVMPSMQALIIQCFPQYSLEIRYVNFLLVYIIPRFLSPMIYGFRDEKFRRYWLRDVARKVHHVVPARYLPNKLR
ncbi:odorant receptor 131-2-like [Electrophorus electricus]|uniref:odorant receptor 131-2-like n=1 Tax=Electrophorus electricus TaxID=8005 RepID=UPI0015D09571|nr:odorant receptor 131-2-like [Electrophorus electricus]